MNEPSKAPVVRVVMRLLQGALIGLGAVLPGISGGVLCVIFGIYKPIMELLSNPIRNFKTHVPKLIPVIIGAGIGFLGIANLLSFFLDAYPDQSVCLFVGLIAGMLPSLLREAGEQGRTRGSYISMAAAFVIVLALLFTLNYVLSVSITPNFGWYLFCGFCVALSVIAPGMSFSTLLMPLGLYTPFVDGLGHLDMGVILPGALGAIVTVICLAKGINALFEHFYSLAFHAIVGIVVAATIMIVPFGSFAQALVPNLICLVAGVVIALALDKFNSRFPQGGVRPALCRRASASIQTRRGLDAPPEAKFHHFAAAPPFWRCAAAFFRFCRLFAESLHRSPAQKAVFNAQRYAIIQINHPAAEGGAHHAQQGRRLRRLSAQA